MRVQLNKNLAVPHKWFAWFPVIAIDKLGNNRYYYFCWFTTVIRTLKLSIHGRSWNYDVFHKGHHDID